MDIAGVPGGSKWSSEKCAARTTCGGLALGHFPVKEEVSPAVEVVFYPIRKATYMRRSP